MATEIKVVSYSSSASSKINWKIIKFSKLDAQHGTYSDVFTVGDSKWKAVIYPKGAGEVYDHLSLYLCPVDLTKSVDTVYSIALTSQTNPNNKVRTVGKFKFPENRVHGKGWAKFMRLGDFHDPAKGYMVNDTCLITVEVTCTVKEGESNGDGGSVKESEPADKVSESKRRKIKDERQ